MSPLNLRDRFHGPVTVLMLSFVSKSQRPQIPVQYLVKPRSTVNPQISYTNLFIPQVYLDCWGKRLVHIGKGREPRTLNLCGLGETF